MEKNCHRHESFNDFADEYDLFRPHYPQEFARIVSDRVKIRGPVSILEIGCGSGQATMAFAKLGYQIDALDIGGALLDLARPKFNSFPEVRLLNTSFEEFDAENKQYDFSFAASAFHWVKPEIGYRKVHKLLKPSAYFSIFSIKRIFPDSLREDLDDLYRRYAAAFSLVNENFPGPFYADTMSELWQPLFWLEDTIIKEFDIFYDEQSYHGLMRTMSDHRLLPKNDQDRFYLDLKTICKAYGNFPVRCHASAELYRKK